MEDWKHTAYHAVYDTLMRYTWCGDFSDADGFVANFTPEGVLEIKGDRTLVGPDGIRTLFEPDASTQGAPVPNDSAQNTPSGPLRHHISSIRIEVGSPEQARAWAYFTNLGPHGLDHWGRYADVLVPEPNGDRWLFKHRRVSIDGASAVSVAFPSGIPRFG
jgi:hypothetical protein